MKNWDDHDFSHLEGKKITLTSYIAVQLDVAEYSLGLTVSSAGDKDDMFICLQPNDPGYKTLFFGVIRLFSNGKATAKDWIRLKDAANKINWKAVKEHGSIPMNFAYVLPKPEHCVFR